MGKALANNSDYFRIKSKFFINRALTYFSFMLIPIWLQQSLQMNLFFKVILLVFYMMFIMGQWYLLGKEVDHRLKIYFRSNSSVDRILYRILSGGIIMMFLFNIISLLSSELINYVFWIFFISLGIFYSWPTRGKIIEETVSGQFSEFRFLDSFEKTILVLSVIMFLVTLPEVALFQNTDALKLFFDPREKVHVQLWNFMSVMYTPFKAYPMLYNLSWSLHFYTFGMAFYLMAFYGLLRFFVSRRLSVLGVFSIISSWSISKFLDQNFIDVLISTYGLLWVWSILWSTKSASYRSGFFIGLMGYWGCVLDYNFFILLPIQICGIYIFFMNDKTTWFKKQWLKYTVFGSLLSVLTLVTHVEASNVIISMSVANWWDLVTNIVSIKAFYVLSWIGLIILFIRYTKIFDKYLSEFNFDWEKLREVIFGIVILLVIGLTVEKNLIKSFGSLWPIAFLSLLPLEYIFQVLSRLRSRRNMIYGLYILVCLLDSHFEGRVRIVTKLFLDDEILKYINQM
jgi:hypothetical protein